MLELGLEEPDHLHTDAGHPGDGHGRPVVALRHLVDPAAGDGVTLGGPPVAGHDHAVGELEAHDRRAVGNFERGQGPAAGGPNLGSGERVRAGAPEQLEEGGTRIGSGRESREWLVDHGAGAYNLRPGVPR
jgi:hypothetical protein